MTDPDALREDYLSRLDAAMSALPHGVASEIRAGIDEELRGQDAEATVARIAQLGAPERIAQEALGATGDAPALAPAGPAPAVPVTSTRGFAITAALVLGFGGVVVPVVGWIVGIVLVGVSTLWRRWEKLVAILLPVVVIAVFLLIALPAYAAGGGGTVVPVEASSGFPAPQGSDFAANPLVPSQTDTIWSSLIGIPVLSAISAFWLLWRLRGRGPAPVS